MGTQELKPSLLKRQKRRDKRMGEEVIECYRKGWRTKHGKGYVKRTRAENWDDLGSREGIKARHCSARRGQTDNLEPMIRYLRSHVGKHWDGVYSDLCRSLDGNSMTGQHVIHHLRHFVHVNVVKVEGKWITQDGWQPGELEYSPWSRRPMFYVHPKSGVLMEVKKRKRS